MSNHVQYCVFGEKIQMALICVNTRFSLDNSGLENLAIENFVIERVCYQNSGDVLTPLPSDLEQLMAIGALVPP